MSRGPDPGRAARQPEDLAARTGGVLMVAPPDDWLHRDLDWLEEFQPAGVILFRRHLPDRFDATQHALSRLHAWADARRRPLLVAADEEAGFVSQVPHLVPVPPSARALAWAAPPAQVQAVMARYAGRLRQLGLDLSFAPVCDVNSNPRNPVIGVRAFGSQAQPVLDYARAAQAGMHQAGITTCPKHFPGHGDTDQDSHLTLPVVPHRRQRLEQLELVPFRGLLSQSPALMVAHVACPHLGAEDLPATLSPAVTTQLLRQDMRFQGATITDSMDMQGVARDRTAGDAAVRALLAGCDLLLYCADLDRVRAARAGLQAALAAGRLPEARLAEAAARVRRLQEDARRRRAAARIEPLPDLQEDWRWYERLCRAGLRLQDEAGWGAFWRPQAAGEALHLVGWNDALLHRLQRRLAAHGIAADRVAPEALLQSPDPAHQRVLVVLAERLPLGEAATGCLRQVAGRSRRAALANLLTPEVDAPLRAVYTTRLQTADHSDAMLEAVVQRWLDLRASA